MKLRIIRNANGTFHVEQLMAGTFRSSAVPLSSWKSMGSFHTLPEAHCFLVDYIDENLGRKQREEVYTVQIEPFKGHCGFE